MISKIHGHREVHNAHLVQALEYCLVRMLDFQAFWLACFLAESGLLFCQISVLLLACQLNGSINYLIGAISTHSSKSFGYPGKAYTRRQQIRYHR